MLVCSFNLWQSFNYAPDLFCKKTVQIRDQLFLYTDPVLSLFHGLFQWPLYLPASLYPTCGCIQRPKDNILMVLYYVFSFFDNDGVYSKSNEQLWEHLRSLFSILTADGLALNLRWNSWTSIWQKTRVFCSMLFTVPLTGGFYKKTYSIHEKHFVER